MSKNYFIFDENKCVGCEACVVACVLENGFQFPERWRTIFSSNENNTPGIPLFNLSLACNHCDEAPCMKYCPSLAYTRDANTGAVLINSEVCIGCNYCLWNCPYEAPKMNPVTNVIEKCNFCNSRLLEDKAPACASSCPTAALTFSFDELYDVKEVEQIKVPVDPGPSLQIVKSRKQLPPEIDRTLFGDTEVRKVKKEKSQISAYKELPLLIFTTIVSIMVPVSASGILEYLSNELNISFILVGILAAAISLFHLGNKKLFWRSILNFYSSPLSREIVFFSLYMASIVLNLFVDIPIIVMVFFGLGTLVSIDMIYKPLQWNWKTQWHSGQVLLISATFFLLLNQFYIFLIVLLLIRLGLTILMYSKEKLDIMPIIWILFMIKTGVLIYNDFDLWLIISVYIIGEIAARIVFYTDLKIYGMDESFKNSEASQD